MARLPEIPRRNVTTEAAKSRVSPQDIRSPYQSLAAGLDTIGKDLEEYSVAESAVAGDDAVYRDKDGNLTYDPKSNLTRAGRAYNNAARSAYGAQAGLEIEGKIADMRIKHAGNPEAFETEARAYVDSLKAKNEETGIGGVVGRLGERAILSNVNGIKREIASNDRTRLQKSILSQITMLDDEMAQLAATGGTGTDEYKERAADVDALYRQMVDNPFFAFPDEERTRRMKEMEGRHLSEAMIGQTRKIYEEQGYLKAQEFAEGFLTNENLNLSPSERRKYMNTALSSLNTSVAARRAELQAAKDEASDLFKLFDSGAPVDGNQVHLLAQRLHLFGDPRTANKLIQAQRRAQAMDGFNKMDPFQQMGVLQQMRSGENGSYEDKVVRVESSGNPNAKADSSSATGLHQFTKGTWLDLMKRYRPVLYRTTPESQLLALRTNPQVSSQMFAILTQENEAALARANVPVNDATKYLAHFAGAGGAIEAARAPRDAPISHIMSGDKIRANAGIKFNGKSFAQFTAGDLLAWAAHKMSGTGAIDAQLYADVQKDVASDARAMLGQLETGLGQGLPPTQQELEYIKDSVAIVGDQQYAEDVGTFMATYEAGALLQAVPEAEREGYLSELRVAAFDGATAAERDFINAMEKISQRTTQGLKDAPLAFASSVGVIPPVPPLEFGNPGRRKDALAARQGYAEMVSQKYNLGPISVIQPGERDAVATQWAGLDINGKLSALSDLTTMLDKRHLDATLGSMALKDGTGVMAWAGSIFNEAPDVAASIMRGQEALNGEDGEKLKPKENSAFANEADKAIGNLLRAPGFNQIRSTIDEAALARYVDLSLQTGAKPAELNRDRLRQSYQDVTGGIVTYKGQRVIVPQHGMTESEFYDRVESVTEGDLRGAYDRNGVPLTVNWFRNRARLMSAGDGQYWIMNGSTPNAGYALDEDGNPFVLDMNDGAVPVL